MEEENSRSRHVRNIGMDIVLMLLTCFLWNIWVQLKQIEALNDMLQKEKYSFPVWFILTVLTCGIYHEYRMSDDLSRLVPGATPYEGYIAIALSILGLTPVIDCIQQAQINRYYGSNAL